MCELSDLNILGAGSTKTSEVFADIYSDILTRPYSSPQEFIETAWHQFNENNKGVRGNVFEILIACLLYREGIKPIFIQTKIAFIPNVSFDLVVYVKDSGPIVLSIKTSLRERYKQADLEGMFLRNVHRKAKSFLISMDEAETNSVNAKIKSGQVLGLDKVIYAGGDDFNTLITDLKSYEYEIPKPVDVMTAARIVE